MFNFDFLYDALYSGSSAKADKELLQQAIDDLKKHENSEERWEEHAPIFYFLPAEYVGKVPEKQKSLPRMQTLRDAGILKKMKIPLVDAFRGEGIIKKILFVSHRWEEPDQPDVDGEQLKAMKAYLDTHRDIEWVWFDYSSMPQRVRLIHSTTDWRTPKELAEFQLMLKCITDLYLTAHVLVILDGSSASRFWPLMEAWYSMQKVTPDGLRPATEDERRYTIKCIHNATDRHDGEGLVDKVYTKKPEEMHGILKKPDVDVTNRKDKLDQLPKILAMDEHVKEMFAKMEVPAATRRSQ